jgi:hypothetical protein
MNRVSSIFSQILRHVPRASFEAAVKEHKAERHARGFRCWDQFGAMMFCQLGHAQSLREICGGLASCEGKLMHLGMEGSPARSTLAYANEHRPWQLYESIFHGLLEHCQQEARTRKRKFRFKHKLLSIDSTSIALCLKMFDWAVYQRSKGAAKVHMVLDHDGYLPCYAVLTDGKQADITVAKTMTFDPDTMLVFDKGYTDYDWWLSLTRGKVNFVTRLKDDADYGVVDKREVAADGDIVRDETILLVSQQEIGKEALLRRVEVWLEDKQATMVFLTNNFKLAATTIAAIYKERWQIELFFESSTCCTPSDVYGISRINCAESTVGGVSGWFLLARHRSTSGPRRIHGAPIQACVADNCFSRIRRKIVVGVTPSTTATSLTDISLRACRSPSR